MGIIKRQTIKGSIYSYLGILVGFITISYIQPHSLTAAQIGLTGILANFSMMFAQLAILGFNGTARYFPYFRNEEKKHHGYLFLACMVSLIGTVVFILLAFLLKSHIIGHNAANTPLLVKYYLYLVPLTIFTLFFNVFDLYSRMLYNMTTGLILREFTKRIFILIPILLIYFKLVSFDVFMLIWLLANIIPTGFMIIRLIKDGQLTLKPDLEFLNKEMVYKLAGICFFTILTGTSPIIIQNVDNYLIFKKLGLSNTGIYMLAFNFGLIITLPTRSLYSIAYTIVAESWKTKDLENIKSVYIKSCVTQLISALFIFLLMWASIDNIFALIPHEYSAGKYAIFFVSIGFLIEAATGINGVILATSKYYRYEALFNLMLVGVIIIANLILIPLYGITGAAIASAITFLIFNLFRYLFILITFKMQPFTINCLLAVITGIFVYYLSVWIVPQLRNPIADTALRSTFITIVFLPAIYFLKLSDDINLLFKNIIAKAKR